MNTFRTRTTLGMFLGLLGSLLPIGPDRESLKASLIGFMSLLYALHELRLFSLPFPQRQRQVPENWRHRYHPYATAILYGILLGLAYITFVPVATLYVVTAAVIVRGSPIFGALLFGLFGLGRSGLLWPLARAGRSFERVDALTSNLFLTRPLIYLINGYALAFSGAYLLARWL